jgi:hypothetical protein
MYFLGAGPKSECNISGAELSGLFINGSEGEIIWVRFSNRQTDSQSFSQPVIQSVSLVTQLRREGSLYWGLELFLKNET